METVIITGANRGIGLALTKTFLQSNQWNVIACCREPENAEELQSLLKKHVEKLEIYPLDVTDEISIKELSTKIENRIIDLLLNNAGIYGGDRQSAFDMDFDAWLETFKVNTMAPLRTAQAFIENLRLSKKPRIVTISSQMGSLNRKSSGSYAYRSSKAAVNKVMQTLAVDLASENIIVTLIHPGWVQTDMGGDAAEITADNSAQGIFKVAKSLSQEDSGHFIQWNGEKHPW